MTSPPRGRTVLAVRAVKVGATALAALIAIVITLGGAIANPGDEASHASEPSVRVVEQSGLDARCAGAGGRAIVLTAAGETRTVPFKQGWRIYRGERPGTLIAVCPD